jgi:hypothetical protein
MKGQIEYIFCRLLQSLDSSHPVDADGQVVGTTSELGGADAEFVEALNTV